MSKENRVSDADWLDEAARYFEKRPTGGEDMAFWANVSNAERCRSIAQSLRSKPVAGVDVKSLEWEMGEAKSAVGLYSVHRYEAPSPKWSVRLDGNALQLYADAEVAARSLAQSHLEEVILSAISLPAQEPMRDPALAYQEAEEAICECGAAGSGEGHSDFCPWLESPWKRWGDAFDASPQPEAVITEEMAERVWLAVLDCPHTITGQEIILRHAAEKEGRNATNQLRERITAALKEA